MRLSAPIYRLKRDAKALARTSKISLCEAQNRIAIKEGYRSWSHLASKRTECDPVVELFDTLSAGEFVLLGARPGQGKTQLALSLVCEAIKRGKTGYFFTLEYTQIDVLKHIRDIAGSPEKIAPKFHLDTSDQISAEHIISALGSMSAGDIAVVDYLQLLDQIREKPSLQDQISALQNFVRQKGCTLIMLSQISREFELRSASMPGIDDVRLPNPLDLSAFSRSCFLHEGEISLSDAA